MESTLQHVDKLYATLNSLRPLKQEDQDRLSKKFRLEFSYNSNHIEGNTLTYGETELLLIFDDTTGNHQLREYEEMKAHDVAYHFIEDLAKDTERPLTEQVIKNLNELILVRPYWKEAITQDGQSTRREIKVGNYKEFPNSVRLQNGEMFEYASPTETPIQMRELMEWYRDEEGAIHPVTLAAMLHYKFVRIHPFDDGNGRISRLLMNYVLLKNGYPPVIIKSADKANYLRVLHQADVGDYEPLINYVGEQVVWSLETSIKAGKGESLEDKDDFIKEIEVLKRKVLSKEIGKSPKVIHDAFSLIKKKVWPSILSTLRPFESLFNEGKEAYSVNNMPEYVITNNISPLDIVSFTKIGKSEIFGEDVYKKDIHTVSWQYKMYSLKGAKGIVDSTVSIVLEFHNYKYQLQTKINATTINKLDKTYDRQIIESEIEEITTLLKKSLLTFIKDKLD